MSLDLWMVEFNRTKDLDDPLPYLFFFYLKEGSGYQKDEYSETLFSSFIHFVGFDWDWIWVVIIGHRSSKSTLGANNIACVR